jgi:chromate transporter
VEILWLFLVCLRASLLSLGGQSALPLLRQDLVSSGLTTDAQIIDALAIGRVTPGPGGLYIVVLGYFAMGLGGAVAALVATVIPPLLVLPLAAYLRPRLSSRRVDGAIRGAALSTSALVLVTTVDLIAADPDGWEVWQWLVLTLAVGIAIQGRAHPIVIIGIGAAMALVLSLPW